MVQRWRWASVFAVCAGAGLPGPQRLVFDLHPRKKSDEHRSSRTFRRLDNQRSYPNDLGNYDNVQYHLEVEVGEPCSGGPGQRFSVVPDTGSSDVWVPAVNCTKCKDGTSRYDISRSCHARMVGDRITFRYGDGTIAAGVTFFDSLAVGALKVQDQYLILVDDMEAETHMKSDGILGLAHHYEYDRQKKGSTFMTTVFKEHPQLPQMFSFFLTGDISSPSKLVFGDPDIKSYSKEPHFRYGKGYYMSHTELWITSLWSIGWSGTGVEVSFPDRGVLGSPVLVDSGSSLIVLAPDIYDKLLKELTWRFTGCHEMKEQQIISCDCPPANDLSRVPSLVMNLIDEEDKQFALCMSPDEYILESIDEFNGRPSCVPSLQRGSENQPVPIIFGMTFMRSFYTNFDIQNGRIGFARNIMSPLPAGAKCSIDAQPILRRAIWLSSLAMAVASATFALVVILTPFGCCKGSCCGYAWGEPEEDLSSASRTSVQMAQGPGYASHP